jgi:hypothetical protein
MPPGAGVGAAVGTDVGTDVGAGVGAGVAPQLPRSQHWVHPSAMDHD